MKMQKSKCKVQNCGGPLGGLLFLSRKNRFFLAINNPKCSKTRILLTKIGFLRVSADTKNCPAPNCGISLFGAGQCGSPLICHFYGGLYYTKLAETFNEKSDFFWKKIATNTPILGYKLTRITTYFRLHFERISRELRRKKHKFLKKSKKKR